DERAGEERHEHPGGGDGEEHRQDEHEQTRPNAEPHGFVLVGSRRVRHGILFTVLAGSLERPRPHMVPSDDRRLSLRLGSRHGGGCGGGSGRVAEPASVCLWAEASSAGGATTHPSLLTLTGRIDETWL